MRCEIVSWGRINQLSRKIANSIRKAGFQPDIVVAVARGGYVPARQLCDLLDIYDLTSVRIMHYTSGAQQIEHARLVMPLAVDVSNKRILLVDDVTDSGDTLELAYQHITEHGAAAIKTAVLHHKQLSTFIPDYYGQKITKWRWLIYPWAMVEDISGFMAHMEPRPASIDEASNRLEEEYGLRVPSNVLEDAFAMLKQRAK